MTSLSRELVASKMAEYKHVAEVVNPAHEDGDDETSTDAARTLLTEDDREEATEAMDKLGGGSDFSCLFHVSCFMLLVLNVTDQGEEMQHGRRLTRKTPNCPSVCTRLAGRRSSTKSS